MKFSVCIAVGCVLGGVVVAANAGTNAWTSVGPDGGNVGSVAYLRASSGEVIASTDIAIYLSENYGQDWERMLRYPHAGGVPVAIAINPVDPDRVLLVSNHLYRSVDGGRTWNFPSGPPAQTPSVAQRPTCVTYARDGSIVWTGTESGRVYRSVDFGDSWQEYSTGLPLTDGGIVEIDVDAASNAVAYVRTGTGRLYRTINGGTSWAEFAVGEVHRGLAVSPTEADVMLALRNPYPFRSLNRGDTWFQSPLPNFVHIEFAPQTPSRAIGILRTGSGFSSRVTADNGAIFWFGGSRLPFGGIRALAIHPGNHDRALVGGALGLASTSDSGTAWLDGMRGIREASFVGLLAAPEGFDSVHALSYDASFVHRRDPSSSEWQPVARGASVPFGAASTAHFALARGYDGPNTLYMSRQGGFARSDDGGVTWQSLSPLQGDDLVFDPRNAAIGYAASRTAGIFKTINGNITWNPSNFGLGTLAINEIVIDPNDSNILFAGSWTDASSIAAVFKSYDAGATWSSASVGLGSTIVNKLVFQPGSSTVMYAATKEGMFRSENAGAAWTRTTPIEFGEVTNIAVDPQVHMNLYATPARDARVVRSVDGGITWERLVDGGLDFGTTGTSIALSPSAPNIVVAARRSAGLYEIEIAPDLQLEVSRPTFALDTPRSLTFTVTNRGPFAVSRAQFTATVPVNFKETELRSSAGPCSYIPPTLRCPIGALAAHSTATILLEGSASGMADTITAAVSAHEPDVVTMNNAVTVSMVREADVRVMAQASAASVLENELVGYVITITNDGPSPAANIRATMTYQGGVIREPLPAGCGLETGNVVCTFATLASGTSREVALAVSYSRIGNTPVYVAISSTSGDINAANDSATVSVSIQPRPAPPPSPSPSRGGGGGSLNWAFVLLMAGLAATTRRRLRLS